MNIKEMEENGTIDYYLELKSYIGKFVDSNYPLSQEDLRSIIQNDPTDNVLRRNETMKILNGAMEDVLKNVAERNGQIIDEYTSYTTQDFKQEIFQMKQEMLEKLWEEQHKEDQFETEQITPTNEQERLEAEMMQGGQEQPVNQQESLAEELMQSAQSQPENQQEGLSEGEQYTYEDQVGQDLIDDAVETGSDVRADEIDDAVTEIVQTERDYIQMQQQPQPQQNMDNVMIMGE